MDKIEGEVKGVVKWFSKSSNYGFITSDENIDYYFHGDDLKGFTLDRKDEVFFIPSNSKVKFKAKNIRLIQKGVDDSNLICCAQCKKNIIPELKTIEIPNPYFKFIKSVQKNYECPECEFVFSIYEDENSTTNLFANLVLITICIVLLYQFFT